jgi:hypothetical protein
MLKGGAFIAQGASTCVFYPRVACKRGTKVPHGILPPGNYVSRLITVDNQELEIQMEIGVIIKQIQELYPDVRILDYMNFAISYCEPLLREDELLSARGNYCKLRNKPALDNVEIQKDYINLITPKQKKDIRIPRIVNGVIQVDPQTGRTIYDLAEPFDVTIKALYRTTIAAATLNGEGMVHFDTHIGNLAWLGNNIVLHDWGLARSKEKYLDTFLGSITDTREKRADLKRFGQYFLHMLVLEKFAKPDGTLDLTDNQKLLMLSFHDTLGIVGSTQPLFMPHDPETLAKVKSVTLIAYLMMKYDVPVNSAAEAIIVMIKAAFEYPRSQETTDLIDEYTIGITGLLGLSSSAPKIQNGGMSMTSKFNRCVKSVKKTIRPRKGSTAESGAIAVCTTSILHPRGRTLKRYSRSRLQTQRRR